MAADEIRPPIPLINLNGTTYFMMHLTPNAKETLRLDLRDANLAYAYWVKRQDDPPFKPKKEELTHSDASGITKIEPTVQ